MTVESPKSPKSLPFAPLVEPAAELTRDELVRYARHLTLEHIGHEGQRRLKNARVLVTGAGGLGSRPCTTGRRRGGHHRDRRR